MGVSVRIVRAAITNTATQDFTVSGFGTPKAAIFIVTHGTTDGTLAAHASISIGATDGMRSRIGSTRGEDALSSTNTDQVANRNSVILVLDSNAQSVDAESSFNSWITDGVRLNHGNQTTGGFFVTVILFGGSDLSAHVSDFRSRKGTNEVCEVSRLSGTCTNVGAADSGGSGETRVDVSGTPFSATDEGNVFVFDATGNEFTIAEFIDSNTVDLKGDASGESNTDTFTFGGPNFQADLLIGFGIRGEPNDTISATFNQTIGFCERVGPTQGAISINELNSRPAGEVRKYISSNRFSRNLSGGSTFGNIEITAFDSTGFDSTTRDTADQSVCYLALAFNGVVNFDVWNFTTPTSDGESTDAGPNFKPQFVLYGMSQETTVDSNINSAAAGSFGISAFTASEAFSNAITTEDDAATINAASISDNIPVNLPDDDQTTGPTATFVSMAATGPRLGWSDTAQGSGMKWVGLAIEEDVAVTVPELSWDGEQPDIIETDAPDVQAYDTV